MDTLERFLTYSSSSDFLKLSEIIEDSPEIVNTKDTRLGLSPLFYAIMSRNIKLVEFLLDQKADADIRNSIGDSPLHEAADHGLPSVVKLLIDHKAEVDVQNEEGETPLHNAAYRGDTESIKILLQAGAEINIRNKVLRTPLHLAVIGSHCSCVTLLLKYGASPHLLDVDSLNPRDIAASQGLEGLFEFRITDLYSIKEVSEEDTASLVSHRNLSRIAWQPDSELSIRRSVFSDLHFFLIKNGLEECLEPLNNIGVHTMSQLLNSEIDLETLTNNGVSRIGKAIGLIIKIEEIRGILDQMEIKFPSQPYSMACCSNELAGSSVILSVEEWLRLINLDEEKEVFRKAGYFDLEILYKQMHTKYPINHFFLKTLGVSSDKNRDIIIHTLKKESGLYLGKNLNREQSRLICGCAIF